MSCRREDRRVVCWTEPLAVVAILLTVGGTAGCGGGSHLPKPRPPEDDEPVVVAPAPPPGAQAPSAAPAGAAPAANGPPPAAAAADASRPSIIGANVLPNAAPGAPAGPSAGNPAEAEKKAAIDRRKVAASNLHKIGAALERYRGKHARYPDQAIVSRDGVWLLSWRVALLPFLGQEELYARFKLDQPWNSPHNKELLAKIPDVYRSPERNDQTTCVQLITGPKTAYERPAGLSDRLCPDGLVNTMFLAEVNYELSRPWTQPEDYLLAPARVHQDLFQHRLDGALVVFGGEIGPRLLPGNVSDEKLMALLTPNGRERVDGEASSRELNLEPYEDLIESLRESPVTRQFANLFNSPADGPKPEGAARNVAPPAGTERGGPAERVGRSESDAPPTESPADSRQAPPAEELITKAADEVRKLYADEYRTAKKAEDRKKFAKKLLDESKQVEADAPAFFVMLRAARDIAAPAGDLDTALAAQAKLLESFQLDEFATTFKTLETVSPHLEDSSNVGKLYDEASRLADLALERDDFAGAKQAISMAQGAARRLRQQEDLATANRREDEINAARLAFQKIAPHLHSLLRSPDQPTACAAVGRYTALVKRDWNKGLPLLAKGDDLTLRKLATDDLSAPADQELQAALADAWWEWSEQASSAMEKANARLRAVYWYKLAIPGLPPSLSRVRAERRTAEVEAPAEKRQARRS